MSRPEKSFQLLPIFSLTSLVVVVLLTFSLTRLLTYRLKFQLFETEKHLISSLVHAEVLEEFAGNSFAPNDLNDHFIHEMIMLMDEIALSSEMDLATWSGEITWSTDPRQIGGRLMDGELNSVYEGESQIKLVQINTPGGDPLHYTWTYVPIRRDGREIGIIRVKRHAEKLVAQLEALESDVMFSCFLFGIILYGALLSIIFPASRILNHQHQTLLRNAKTLAAINQELQETQQKLVQKERYSAIGEVCGAVAHGLKNPIASVRSAVQLLSLTKQTETQHQLLADEILHEVDRLTRRLNDLLNFVKPFHPQAQLLALEDVLRNAVKSLIWKAHSDGLDIAIECEPGLPPLSIDPNLVEEALINVISNAMSASPSGGQITCHLRMNASTQNISITDQGRGIDSTLLPRIFEQFFTTNSQGIGLGLAITKKIMDLHQGGIALTSELNRGTTVTLSFPLAVANDAGGT